MRTWPYPIAGEWSAYITLRGQEVPGAIDVAAGGSGTLTELLNISATDSFGQVVTAGRMQIDLLASGNVKVSGSGPYYDPPLSFASLTCNTRVSNSLGVFHSIELSRPGDRLASAPFSLVVQWNVGEAVNLTMTVAARTSMQLRDSGTVNAQVRFGNSLDWLGVRTVTDPAGIPVASFSLTSSSTGADWGHPFRQSPKTGLGPCCWPDRWRSARRCDAGRAARSGAIGARHIRPAPNPR